MEERRFGEVHLTRHVLHPALVPRAGEDAHGGGVAAERPARERVHLHDPQAHSTKLACFPRAARARSRSPIGRTGRVDLCGHKAQRVRLLDKRTHKAPPPAFARPEALARCQGTIRVVQLDESRSVRGAVDCVQTGFLVAQQAARPGAREVPVTQSSPSSRSSCRRSPAATLHCARPSSRGRASSRTGTTSALSDAAYQPSKGRSAAGRARLVRTMRTSGFTRWRTPSMAKPCTSPPNANRRRAPRRVVQASHPNRPARYSMKAVA